MNLPFSNIQPSVNGVRVKYPDGIIDQATHTATLDVPSLPLQARQVHLFNKLASGSLLSLGQLCDAGCTAYFDNTAVYIFYQGKIILHGNRSIQTNHLWQLDPQRKPAASPICHSLNALLDNPTIAERIKFYHASMFSPTLQTFGEAIDAGYLTTFPSISSAQLRKYPPRAEATVKGHLRAIKKGLKYVQAPSPSINNFTDMAAPLPVLIEDDEEEESPTPTTTPTPIPHGPWQRKPLSPSTSLPSPSSIPAPTATPTSLPTDIPSTATPPRVPTVVPTELPISQQQIDEIIRPAKRTNHVYADCQTITGQIYTDQTGKMLTTSAAGMNYCLVLYDFDSNLVWAVPMPSRTKHQILKAMKETFKLLSSRGLKPQLQRLDNECSKLLKDYMSEEGVDYQLTPKGKHSRNAAEKAIQTAKNHFGAGIASTHPDFPVAQWCKLIQQANITLNLMRPSRINPQLSAYAQVFGLYDYSKTPMPPPGMKVLAHILPADRRSFDTHAIKGFSVGPAMEHYRCFKIYIPSTGGVRIADTVRWFPHGDLKMPIASKDALLQATLADLRSTLKSSVKNNILPPEGTTSRTILLQLHDIFKNNDTPNRPSPEPTAIPTAPSKDPIHVPRVAPVQVPRVVPTQVPRVVPTPVPRVAQAVVPNVAQSPKPSSTPTPVPIIPAHRSTRQRSSTKSPTFHYANSTITLEQLEDSTIQRQHAANAVLNPDTGTLEEYRQLIKGKQAHLWQNGGYKELARLAQGCKKRGVTGSNTAHFINHRDKPSHKKATYARIVSEYRAHKSDPYRIRITVGGDQILYIGETFTPNADLITAKVLFNSVISTPGAKFMTIDIKDFYLSTDMDEFEYMWLPRWIFTQEFIDDNNIAHLFHNDRIMVEIRKGMYGLPQAGRLAYLKLINNLATSGYVKAGLTPGLFKHTTRNTIFSLVVDDFGVKYSSLEDANHLIQALRQHYTVTTDFTGKLFLGMHLDWNYKLGHVDLSLPGYVVKALTRFLHKFPAHPQDSPHPCTRPNYGAKVQWAEIAKECDLTPEQLKYCQQIFGVFLFYARVIDSTMLHAIGTMATSLSTAQWRDLQPRILHFLNYAATHPNAKIRYRKSDMHLWIHTDATYLSEPKARSRASGFHYFSDKPKLPISPEDPPPMPNHPVHVPCKVIDTVMSSTQEAETGGGYINAKAALPIRQAAIEMGHPQGPTPLQFDNKCAMGILTGVLKQRQSKGMDMRFYWLRDRHSQNQFHCHWKKGIFNLGDYQSKPHPSKTHRIQRPSFVLNNLTEVNKLMQIMAHTFKTPQRPIYAPSARVC